MKNKEKYIKNKVRKNRLIKIFMIICLFIAAGCFLCLSPMFNIQLTYRVKVDEQFLNLLESDYIYVEVYYLRDNVQSILGKGKIPLVDLVNAEKNNKTS